MLEAVARLKGTLRAEEEQLPAAAAAGSALGASSDHRPDEDRPESLARLDPAWKLVNGAVGATLALHKQHMSLSNRHCLKYIQDSYPIMQRAWE